jgi:7-cyano-7-deazaguanine synthase
MKVIALVSGGLDSTVMIYKLLSEGHKIKTIIFDYGQRHRKELIKAFHLMKNLNIDYTNVDISDISRLLTSSSLIDTTKDLISAQQTIVPNRNAIFLSIATAYAINEDYDAVAFAAHKSDILVYPDCSLRFVDTLECAFQLGNKNTIQILMPFQSMTKTEVVKLGKILDVPFGKTWSCYKGGQNHCGICPTCLERKKAFKEAKIIDPTDYEQ